jgi:hypothetical protein
MRNQTKRLDRLSAKLPARERVLAILDAINRDDMKTVDSLLKSAPLKNYCQTDAAITDSVRAAEFFSMQFDRVFSMVLAMLLSAKLSVDADSPKVEQKMERELHTLVAGLDLFSKHIGLSADRLLAHSVVVDKELIGIYRRDLGGLSDDDLLAASAVCSLMGDLWNNRAFQSPFKAQSCL